MTGTQRKRLLSIGTLGTLLTLLVIVCDLAKYFEPLERALYDLRVRQCQRYLKPPTDQIVHVDIDDGALAQIGRWPWQRTMMADLIDEMNDAGAKLIVLDVLFAEKSRDPAPTSGVAALTPDARLAEAFNRGKNIVIASSFSFEPAAPADPVATAIVGELQRDLELKADELTAKLNSSLIARKIDSKDLAAQVTSRLVTLRGQAMHDRISLELSRTPTASFEEVMKLLLPKAAAETGLGSVLERQLAGEYEHARTIRALHRFAVPTGGDVPPLLIAGDGSLPIEPLADAAAFGGFVNYLPESDGIIRRIPLAVWHENAVMPQIGLATACAAMGVDIRSVRFTSNAVIIPRPQGDVVIPTRVQPDGRHAGTGAFIDIPLHGEKVRDRNSWERMYDYPDFKDPTASRLPILDVYTAMEARDRIARNDLTAATRFLPYLLTPVDESLAAEVRVNPPVGDALVQSVTDALDNYAFFVKSLSENPTPSDAEKEQLAALRAAAPYGERLRLWQAQRAESLTQLAQQRAKLANALGGRVVFVGSIATGAADFVASSLDARCPGVYLHGATFNAIMTGEFLRSAPRWVTVLATLVIGLLSTVAIALLSPAMAFGVILALVGGYATLNGFVLFDRYNLIIDAAGPLVAAGVVWSGVTLIQFVREISERARLTRRFSSYVDPTLVNYVIENPEQVRLEAHEKEMSVAFSDLAGFTTLSEKLRADSAKLLGQYMEAMVPLIRARHGYVNKFLGDGIMFFFGAPIDNPDHAADAVATILDMQQAIGPFNQRLVAQGLPTLSMRAGLSTGMMVVGDAGPSFASDYTVLGDAVNFAARLEGANKPFGTNNLISARTAELIAGKFVVRPIADLIVVGKEQSVFVHEALAPIESATDEQKQLAKLTTEMVEAFTANRFDECLAAATEMERLFGQSKLTTLYTEEVTVRRQQPASAHISGKIQLFAK